MWNKSREAKAEGFRKEWEQRIEEMRAEQERRTQEMRARFALKPSTPADIEELRASLDLVLTRLEKEGRMAKAIEANSHGIADRIRKVQTELDAQAVTRGAAGKVREAGTELDLYEADTQRTKQRHGWSGRCQRREQDKGANSKQEAALRTPDEMKAAACTRGALGYDGKQLLKAFHNAEAQPANKSVGHNQWQGRQYDPAGNPEHTMPWLLLDPYSPIHICNPDQDRLIAAHFEQSPLAPVNVSNMSYHTPLSTDTDRKMSKALPWGDAFEDLMGLETTGKMAERNYSTRGTPDDWIAGMVGRGILRGWQLDGQGRMIRGAEKKETTGTKVPEQSPTSAAAKSSPEPAQPYSATEIVAAIEKARETQSRPKKVDSSHRQAVKAVEKPDISTSSSSKSPWSFWDGEGDNMSVISTITKTERRTLPDGRVEIKKSLKQKFADGREESQHSIELENSPRGEIRRQPEDLSLTKAREALTMPKQQLSRENKKVQFAQESRQQTEPKAEEQNRGGWFWR